MLKDISAGTSRRFSLLIKTVLLCLLLAHIIDFSVASDLGEILQPKSNEHNLQLLKSDSFGSRHLLDHEREDDHKEDEDSDDSKHHKNDGKESQLQEVIYIFV